MLTYTEPLLGLMIVSEGIHHGLRETRFPSIIETIGAWGIRILFSSILVKFFSASLMDVWMCMAVDNIFRALGLSLPILLKKGNTLFDKKTA